MVSKAYQDAIKKLWDGLCDVFVQEADTDKASGRTVQKEVIKLQKEPCRVSYSSISATSPQSEAAAVRQVIKLFISKDVDIPEGSKIVVTQEGRTETYRRTGKSAVYSVHQEIMLELFKEYA